MDFGHLGCRRQNHLFFIFKYNERTVKYIESSDQHLDQKESNKINFESFQF